MLKNRYIDYICIAFALIALAVSVVMFFGQQLGIAPAHTQPAYLHKLFDSTKVHTIDIIIDDWNSFLQNAPLKKYSRCTMIIDGESFKNVGIRAKGNNSKRLVEKYSLSRYSLKIEMDHYTGQSYYGLDKFSLDSSFQDNSYMKTRITYDMMSYMGVKTPLYSYVYVRVNGKDWGLFVALEEPEEAFAKRNYGVNYGQLYKPDYKSLKDENNDVALKYTDDNFDSYDNIFRNAKFKPSPQDKHRLIKSLKALWSGENLDEYIDVDQVIRYFTVQVFVVNLDSYLGKTGHNYFLYEQDGKISMIPWDYNLAFSTYSLGMPNPINDSTLYINYPIDTPASWDIMSNRPLYHNLMKNPEYFNLYHRYFRQFIDGYFKSGHFEDFVNSRCAMIDEYVKKDPTAFCSYEDFLTGVFTIKQFCLLRAMSVDSQLSGTIPSTIAGQAKDKSAFIDGSGIHLEDMGEIADLANPPHKNNQ